MSIEYRTSPHDSFKQADKPEASDHASLSASSSSDRLSASSSWSDVEKFQPPFDLPDGPQYDDLSAHINKVVEIQSNHCAANPPGTSPGTRIDYADQLDRSGPPAALLQYPFRNHVSSPLLSDVKDVMNDSSFFPAFGDNIDEAPNDWASWAGAAPINPNIDWEEYISDQSASDVGDEDTGDGTVMAIADENVEEEDDDDFGGFTSFAPSSLPQTADVTQSEVKSSQQASILEVLLSRLEPSLERAFSYQVSTDTAPYSNEGLSDLFTEPVGTENVTGYSAFNTIQKNLDPALWRKLSTTTRMHEFRFHWTKSPIYTSHLKSIGVNVHDAMPVFANQLRLLEPVLVSSSTTTASTEPVTVVCDENTSGDPTNPNTHPKSSPVVTHPSADPKLIQQSSCQVNSGAMGILLEPLDLDYFESRHEPDSDMSKKETPLEALEAELFGAQPPCSLSTAVNSQPILPYPTMNLEPPSNTDNQSAPIGRSKAVRNALARLPKLTYMRARSLVFPTSSTAPKSE